MKQIVCLSNEPRSPSPGRTQQLVARLKDVQVLYFSPAESWRDQRFRGKGRAVKPNITTYTLPPLLLPVDERYGELFQLGQRKLARYIAGKIAKHRFRAPLLWTTCPEQVHLLDRLRIPYAWVAHETADTIADCDVVSEALGITESTSRSQYTRARQLLQKQIKELYK